MQSGRRMLVRLVVAKYPLPSLLLPWPKNASMGGSIIIIRQYFLIREEWVSFRGLCQLKLSEFAQISIFLQFQWQTSGDLFRYLGPQNIPSSAGSWAGLDPKFQPQNHKISTIITLQYVTIAPFSTQWCLYHPDKGFQYIFIIQSPQFLMKGSTTLIRDNLFSFLYSLVSLPPW